MLFTNEWYQAGNEIVFMGHMGLVHAIRPIPVNPTVLVPSAPTGPTPAEMAAAERELKAMFGEDVVIMHHVQEATPDVKPECYPGMTVEQVSGIHKFIEKLCTEQPERPTPKKPHLRLV